MNNDATARYLDACENILTLTKRLEGMSETDPNRPIVELWLEMDNEQKEQAMKDIPF